MPGFGPTIECPSLDFVPSDSVSAVHEAVYDALPWSALSPTYEEPLPDMAPGAVISPVTSLRLQATPPHCASQVREETQFDFAPAAAFGPVYADVFEPGQSSFSPVLASRLDKRSTSAFSAAFSALMREKGPDSTFSSTCEAVAKLGRACVSPVLASVVGAESLAAFSPISASRFMGETPTDAFSAVIAHDYSAAFFGPVREDVFYPAPQSSGAQHKIDKGYWFTIQHGEDQFALGKYDGNNQLQLYRLTAGSWTFVKPIDGFGIADGCVPVLVSAGGILFAYWRPTGADWRCKPALP